MGRKRTPDILGGILDGEPEDDSPESKKRKLKPVEQPRVKATYYLMPDTVAALERAWLELRSMADDGARTKVSKSAITDAALRIALADLASRGEESQLASMLVNQ